MGRTALLLLLALLITLVRTAVAPATPALDAPMLLPAFEKHVVRLACPTKQYDWGQLAKHNCKVAKFAASTPNTIVDPDAPYAELWMGAHPSGPALVFDDDAQVAKIPLSQLLNSNLLGNKISEKYGNELPFLFKVLSIRKALSIQAHPDKTLGEHLHAEKPDIYKDPNHKPEMAIALTNFEALCGFRPLEEIVSHLNEYPELRAVAGNANVEQFQQAVESSSDSNEEKKKSALKAVFRSIMTEKADFVAQQVEKLVTRLKETKHSDDDHLHALIIRLSEQFPGDVGVLCALLLNYIVLEPGQSLFLGANEPHAYLSGDCIECMAASDNVVRAGLTPKFKDVNVLVDMLTYSTKNSREHILTPVAFEPVGDFPFPRPKHTILYNPPIEEFSVLQTTLPHLRLDVGPTSETIPPLSGASILIVVQGSIWMEEVEEGVKVWRVVKEGMVVHMGHVYFVPAGVGVRMRRAGSGQAVIYRAFSHVEEVM